MKLSVIAKSYPGKVELFGETEITGLNCDSRKVVPGDLYFCLPGLRVDGHSFAEQVMEKGAAALVVERRLPLDIPQILVEDARAAMSYMAQCFYDYPAKKMRGIDPHMLIVFQTTSREYAFDAFPVHPFDYLIKPCRQDEVDNVLTEAERVLNAGDPEITVSAKGELKVPVRTICAAVAEGRGVELQLSNSQPLKTSETFRSISEKLEPFPQFLLINRGVIINMDHVLAPEGDSMKMKDGSLHPIKVNGRGSVMSAFTQYMISRVERWQ